MPFKKKTFDNEVLFGEVALHTLQVLVSLIEDDVNKLIISTETALDALFAAVAAQEVYGLDEQFRYKMKGLFPEDPDFMTHQALLYSYLEDTSLAGYKEPSRRGDPGLLVPPELPAQLEADIKRKLVALVNAPTRKHAEIWGPGLALVIKKSLQTSAQSYEELLPSVDLETASEFDENTAAVAAILAVSLKVLGEDYRRFKKKDRETLSRIAINLAFLFALFYFYNLN